MESFTFELVPPCGTFVLTVHVQRSDLGLVAVTRIIRWREGESTSFASLEALAKDSEEQATAVERGVESGFEALDKFRTRPKPVLPLN